MNERRDADWYARVAVRFASLLGDFVERNDPDAIKRATIVACLLERGFRIGETTTMPPPDVLADDIRVFQETWLKRIQK